MTASAFVQAVEPRRHFAAGGFDRTWHYSQAAIDAVAGTHLEIGSDSVVPGPNGRTYLLGTGDDLDRDGTAVRTYVVALGSDGRPDPAFAVNGVLATSFEHAVLTLDPDGRLYVAGGLDHRVLRYSGSGRIDRTFGGKTGIRFAEDANSGVFVSDRPGRVLTVENDRSARVVRVLSITADGASTLHEESYAPADENFGPVLNRVDVVRTKAGLALLYGQQFYDQTYVDNFDPPPGYTGYAETHGEIHTTLMAADGKVLRTQDSDTGKQQENFRPVAHGDGVRLIIGSDSSPRRRAVDVSASKPVRRSFYDVAFGDASEDGVVVLGRSLLILPDGRSVVGGSARRQDEESEVAFATLGTSGGTPDPAFGRRGTLSYAPNEGGADVLDAKLADDGALLLGRVYYTKAGRQYDVRRVTPGPAPLADLVSLRVSPPNGTSRHSFTASVRYFAAGGVVRKTIGSPDLTLIAPTGTVAAKLLGTRLGDDGSVVARYRFDYDADGQAFAYAFDLHAAQVAAKDDTANTARRLATLTY